MSYYRDLKACKMPTTYVAYDLETTGLPDEDPYPVQYGAIKVVDGVETDCFETLVALPDGVHIEKEAYDKHGISESCLVGAQSQIQAYLNFSDFVGDYPLIGYNNYDFDDLIIDKIADEFNLNKLTSNYIVDPVFGKQSGKDLMVIVGGKFGFSRRPSLDRVCSEFDVVNNKAHDAVADCRATSEIYLKARQLVKSISCDYRDIEVEPVSDELANQTIVFTYARDLERQCQVFVRRLGAQTRNSVTKSTTLLVNFGNKDSRNVKNAKKYGIPIWSQDEFLSHFNINISYLESINE